MTHSIPRAPGRATPAAIGLSLLVAVSACRGGEKVADCKAVGASYAALVQKEVDKPISGRTAEQKAQVLSLIPQLKEAMVLECQEKKWDDEARRCVVAAQTKIDLEKCQPRMPTEEPAEPSATPASGSASEPAPAGGAEEKPDSP